MKMLKVSLALVALLSLVGLPMAQAQTAATVNWTGGSSDGIFNTAGNWDPARLG